MEKVRIGIVGSAFAADFHADCYSRNEHCTVAAVAALDRLEEFAQKWKVPSTYTDYRQMIGEADIDLVAVCVPNFLHHDVVMAAAAADKHVICEKPLATTVADAEEALAAVQKAGIKLFYAEDWMFAPSLARVKQIIDEGAIGRVLYLKAKEVHNGTHSPFAKNKEKCGGGSLIHLGIHPAAYAIALLGGADNPVTAVTGFVTPGSEGNFVHKDNTGEDWGAGVMRFRDGRYAFIEGNYITVGGMDDKIEIYGTEGVIKIDLTFGSNVEVYSRPGYGYAIEKADNAVGWTRPAIDEFYNLGYVPEMNYFIDCVRFDREPRYEVSGRMGLACLQVIKAMYASAEQGVTVKGEWS